MKNLTTLKVRISVLACVLFMFFSPHVDATSYYVAKNGNDGNSGTLSSPFKTIQKAVDVAYAGDVIYIREGIYRETITMKRSGQSGNRIKLMNYNNEYVEVSAFDVVPSRWAYHNPNMYKVDNYDLPLDEDLNLLLVNKQITWLARWPNRTNDNLFDLHMKAINSGVDGRVTVSGLPSLPGSAWSDVVMQYYGNPGWITWRVKLNSRSGDNLYYTKPSGLIDFNHTPDKGDGQIVLMNSVWFLDKDREFYYDKSRKILYFKAPGGNNPNNYEVEARVRKVLLNALNKRYIELQGITFMGGQVDLEGSDGSLMYNCRSMLGNFTWGFSNVTNSGAYAGDYSVDAAAANITIERCEIAYATGAGVRCYGTGSSKFDNNHVHNMGWIRTWGAGVFMATNAINQKIRYNTMYYNGRNLINGDGQRDCEISYNNLYRGCLTTKDGGLFYDCCNNSQNPGTNFHHNWVHDGPGKYTAGIYYDNWSGGTSAGKVKIHHNAMWNLDNSGIHINGGAEIDVFNNTVHSTPQGYYTWSGAPMNPGNNNRIWNNYTENGGFFPDQPVDRSNNVKAGWSQAAESNGVPKSGGPLHNTGRHISGITDNAVGTPDVGAYERGATHWTPGANWNPACSPKEGIFYYRTACGNCYESGGTQCISNGSSFKNSSSVSDLNEKNLSLKVYPNPVSGEVVTLEVSLSDDSDLNLKIYDNTGRLLYNKLVANYSAGHHVIDLSTDELNMNEKGLYFMEISAGNYVDHKKLIIN